MLTPQEVQEKKFKQALLGGYDMAAVDEFLETVTDDYNNLFKENAVLKNKMKVLVDKVEEYRNNDDAIRQAYLAIKRQAEKELEETRGEAAKLRDEATGELSRLRAKLEAEIKLEEARLTAAREQTVAFVSALRELYSSQMEKLACIPEMEIKESPGKAREAAIRETALEISRSIAPAMEEITEETGEDTRDLAAETLTFESRPDDPSPEIIARKRQHEAIESFEINYAPGVLTEDDFEWEHEHDTEVPRPRSQPPADIEKLFGSQAPSLGDKPRGAKG